MGLCIVAVWPKNASGPSLMKSTWSRSAGFVLQDKADEVSKDDLLHRRHHIAENSRRPHLIIDPLVQAEDVGEEDRPAARLGTRR